MLPGSPGFLPGIAIRGHRIRGHRQVTNRTSWVMRNCSQFGRLGQAFETEKSEKIEPSYNVVSTPGARSVTLTITGVFDTVDNAPGDRE